MKYFIFAVQYTFALFLALWGASLTADPVGRGMQVSHAVAVGCTCLLLSGLLLIASAILYSKKE